ncbi:hypothetical protein [Actinotalea sp. K2]|uniref:hypothetical protein n=1 Tax=Actinotalea sp. K2 TaxID=2939438 RepID=UPI002017F98D|nr:hypothetical protein [Actinotalea sp. K2]MCL3862086.1 hypothetical protein [Actinotalea sp. K2]
MADQRAPAGVGEIKPVTPPEGLSQFLARILDQLSLSSWLPAALVASVGAVILELRSQTEIDVAQAVMDLTAKPLGVLVVAVFAVLALTMLLQAFELTAIRLLEGYWPPFASAIGLTGLMVRFHLWRQDWLRSRLVTRRIAAFRSAREDMLDIGVDKAVLEFLRVSAAGETFRSRPPADVIAAGEAINWREYSNPALLRSFEAVERALSGYPKRHRTMPTRLGNTLRAVEDEIANQGDGPLRTFVIRNWHLLPLEIRVMHDQYRNRLDLYCTLVFVCGGIAAGGGALLGTVDHGVTAAWVVFSSFALCSLACYRAGITSAGGYTAALQAIDAEVGRINGQTATAT